MSAQSRPAIGGRACSSDWMRSSLEKGYYNKCMKFANVAQSVEHAHGKGEAVGSNPIVGSLKLQTSFIGVVTFCKAEGFELFCSRRGKQ